MEDSPKAQSANQSIKSSQESTNDSMRAKILAAAAARQPTGGPPKIRTIEEAKDPKAFQDLVNKIRGSAKTSSQVGTSDERSRV
jgi:hypothetical protein